MEQYYEEALKLLKELTVIPAFPGQEDERAEYIYHWIKSIKADANVIIDEVKNVICEVEGKNRDHITVFAAHTDTVFEPGVPRELKEEGNRWYCPGIGDDTANLVNMLMGLKYLLESGDQPSNTLLFVADSCEEGLGNCKGIRSVFETYGEKIREFYTFDLYLGQCVFGAVGSNRYQISVDTRGGHSYLDFGNANAILVLSDIMQRLRSIPLPKEGNTTFNIGTIAGGTSVNTIPQHAEMLYEFRSQSQESLKTMEAQFEWVMEECRRDFKTTKFKTGRIEGEAEDFVRIFVETCGIRPGSAWEPGNMEALERWTEENIKVIRKYYEGPIDTEACSTDANIPLSKGILANMIGTVIGGGAHTKEEWIEPESMKTGMEIVKKLICKA